MRTLTSPMPVTVDNVFCLRESSLVNADLNVMWFECRKEVLLCLCTHSLSLPLWQCGTRNIERVGFCKSDVETLLHNQLQTLKKKKKTFSLLSDTFG